MSKLSLHTYGPEKAARFEAQLLAKGFIERENVQESELRPGQFTKSRSASNQSDFGGSPRVTYRVCERD